MSRKDPSDRTIDLASVETRLRIESDGGTWVVDGARPMLRFGRGDDNDLNIGDRFASRRHGRITCRSGRFYLTDSSRNGTVVAFANGATRLVLKEELLLHGRGAVRLGHDEGRSFSFVVEVRSGGDGNWQVSAESDQGSSDSAINEFYRHGDFWTIRYEGRLVRLKDAKGLHYLAHLLRHPGREFHALDLTLVASDHPGSGDRVQPPAVAAGAGPALDARAKGAYRSRLAELRAELGEAERLHDIGRAERLRDEIEMIAEELAGAVGLGGRDRQAASNAERGRVAVTRRIKDAIARITESHPALGEHLTRSVRTGRFCTYDPGSGRPTSWML